MESERRGPQRIRRGYAEDVFPDLSRSIIGAAMKVHSGLGPGLLESAYESCMCHELSRAGLRFQRQVPIAMRYGNFQLDCGFRVDLLVEEKVVVEIKSVEKLIPLHIAQLLTYLKATRLPLGLILNFNVTHLKHGIRRRVMLIHA